jgi:hypothetical protein
MARGDPNFRLRIPEELLEKFRERAVANNRSATQEIVVTLEAALAQETTIERLTRQIREINSRVDAVEREIGKMQGKRLDLIMEEDIVPVSKTKAGGISLISKKKK